MSQSFFHAKYSSKILIFLTILFAQTSFSLTIHAHINDILLNGGILGLMDNCVNVLIHNKTIDYTPTNDPENNPSPTKTITSRLTADDYAGKLPKEIRELIKQLKTPTTLYSDLDLEVPNGILLVGPPGTGKTLLATIVAGELQYPFFNCSSGDFITKWVGSGSENLNNLFEDAQAAAKDHPSKTAIIFIDEIESLIPNRNNDLRSWQHQTLNTFLHLMDGAQHKNRSEDDPRIIVIGATNITKNIDPAFLRPGRFTNIIYINKPNLETRKELFKLYTKKINPLYLEHNKLDYEALAQQTADMTGDQIKNIIQTAKRIYMDKINTSAEYGKMDIIIFMKAIKKEKAKNLINNRSTLS